MENHNINDVNAKCQKIIDTLQKIINDGLGANPYNKQHDEMKHTMWIEQCETNFPILYLSSILLYKYGKERKCNKYIFATRDCCHWYKIFNKLYPKEDGTQFHCSRLMFENATNTENKSYNDYVLNQIKGSNNIDKTIFIDIHGTGRRMYEYFKKNYNNGPYNFLLSATFRDYAGFPEITQEFIKVNKVYNLIFNARGGPIEMLNYDLVGTLKNYSNGIPIRENIEYNAELIKVYHECIKYLINKIRPINGNVYDSNTIENIKKEIENIYTKIRIVRPIISTVIDHQTKHGERIEQISVSKINEVNVQINKSENTKNESDEEINEIVSKISFTKIISNSTVYGLVWEGIYNNINCAIKMIKLERDNENEQHTNIKNEKNPYKHNEFSNKKTMTKENFMKEVNQLELLSKLRVSPKYYGYTISKNYGFIIMKKMDTSLKNILVNRSLSKDEEKIIYRKIDKMHNKKKIIHGDLKPSNIGVNLDENGKIRRCRMLDCQKVKNIVGFGSKDIQDMIKKDWSSYKKHKDLNTKKDEI